MFIFTPGEPDLVQAAIPGMAALRWLPDGDGLLLSRPIVPITEAGAQVEELYLYRLATGQLTALTDTPAHGEYSVLWLPEIERVLYTGPGSTCDAPCITAGDFYLADLDGESERLTDLGTQIPEDYPGSPFGLCLAERPVWSEVNRRLYYVAECYAPVGTCLTISCIPSIWRAKTGWKPTSRRRFRTMSSSTLSDFIRLATVGSTW